ncbi:MAG: hypothetical protein RBR38_10400 [Desulfomicrobium apsheronum]|nr:hypothetical protein [Desulfomicrobium apsheronum]
MASYLDDYVLDNGLTVLDTEANALVICSQLPADYTGANTTYKLGTKTTPAVTLGNGATSGRKAAVAQITDGSVSATGTATHWALIDTANSRLLAASTLSASQSVTSGNTFTLPAFDAVTLPDPA